MTNVSLPELGEGIDTAIVALWHVKVGDRVNQGDEIVELVTDKASFNVEAQTSGIIKSINFEDGSEVKIGEVLASISE